MSSLVLMRLLERAPHRYDAGMRLLTLGRVDRLHARLAEAAAPAPGARVLELGCGTGALTARLVERGARVTALDQNPEMLDQAQRRLAGAPPGAVRWLECSASEIDALPEAAFDAVVASLCLSEMSPSERVFVLREAARRLRPGAVLAAADEVRPRGTLARAFHAGLRLPQAALAWLVTGSTSRPLPDLAAELRAAGLRVRSEGRLAASTLCCVVAERPVAPAGAES